MTDLPPTFFQRLLTTEPTPPVVLIERFLYAKTGNLISSDPGTGKSTIAVQMAVSLALGQPVFGGLGIPLPRRVYYLAMETLPEELHSQLYVLQDIFALPREEVIHRLDANLRWDGDSIGMNLLDRQDLATFMSKIAEWGTCDLLLIDPMYMVISGDLSEGKVASAFVRVLRYLQHHFQCAVLLNHHTHRERHTSDGSVILESNPFYGSRWLDAYVHTAWHLKKQDASHQGVLLLNRKDRLKVCLPQLTLAYDADTWSCRIQEHVKDTYLSELLVYLDGLNGTPTDFQAVKKALQCSDITLRRLMRQPQVQQKVEFIKSDVGKKTSWRVK